ncbi:hypothetical protein [Priestia flexa]|uniref:hypothetical protein n=1 Tax=Priestia flexa TaxID=86664 RepID=UPI00077C9321|nr:hypothetical protein [Priestia flexa]MED4587685.1 hypothetical protein [Priestia flexa]
MKRVSFNEGTLGIGGNKVTYEIPLEKTNINSIEELDIIKDLHFDFLFPISNMDISSNRQHFYMEMEVESGYLPLNRFKSTSSDEQKYQFIENLCEVVENLKNLDKLVTILDDKNVLVHSETAQIKLLYRGVKGLLPAAPYLEDTLEMQVKRLSLFILTLARYDALRLNGLNEARNHVSQEKYTLVSKIVYSESLEDVLNNIKSVQETHEPKVEEVKKSIFNKFSTANKPVRKTEIKNNKEIRSNKEKAKTKPELKLKEKKASVKDKLESKAKNFESNDRPNTMSFLKNDKIKIILGLGIAFVLVFFVVANMGKDDQKAVKTLGENKQISGEVVQEDVDYLTKGLQYAAIQDYQNAVNNFEKIEQSFKDFNKPNQRAILFSYLMTGNYQKAIDAEPKFAYSVVNYLVSKDKMDEIKNIKSEEPVIKFEQAANAKDYKNVLKYKEEVSLDGRRESLIINAYNELKQFDEGYDFAKSKGNNDLMIKVRQKQINELKSKDEKANQEQIKKYENEIKQLNQS